MRFDPIPEAIAAIREGKPVVVVDDEDGFTFLCQGPEDLDDVVFGGGVNPNEGFVEQEDLGFLT